MHPAVTAERAGERMQATRRGAQAPESTAVRPPELRLPGCAQGANGKNPGTIASLMFTFIVTIGNILADLAAFVVSFLVGFVRRDTAETVYILCYVSFTVAVIMLDTFFSYLKIRDVVLAGDIPFDTEHDFSSFHSLLSRLEAFGGGGSQELPRSIRVWGWRHWREVKMRAAGNTDPDFDLRIGAPAAILVPWVRVFFAQADLPAGPVAPPSQSHRGSDPFTPSCSCLGWGESATECGNMSAPICCSAHQRPIAYAPLRDRNLQCLPCVLPSVDAESLELAGESESLERWCLVPQVGEGELGVWQNRPWRLLFMSSGFG